MWRVFFFFFEDAYQLEAVIVLTLDAGVWWLMTNSSLDSVINQTTTRMLPHISASGMLFCFLYHCCKITCRMHLKSSPKKKQVNGGRPQCTFLTLCACLLGQVSLVIGIFNLCGTSWWNKSNKSGGPGPGGSSIVGFMSSLLWNGRLLRDTQTFP